MGTAPTTGKQPIQIGLDYVIDLNGKVQVIITRDGEQVSALTLQNRDEIVFFSPQGATVEVDLSAPPKAYNPDKSINSNLVTVTQDATGKSQTRNCTFTLNGKTVKSGVEMDP